MTSVSRFGFTATLSANNVLDGSLVLIDVQFQKDFSGRVSATFEGKEFPFYPYEGMRHYQGMFGVPVNHAPGKAEIKVQPEGMDPLTLSFDVADAHYPSENLKVDNRKVNPRKKDLIRINRENKEVGAVKQTVTLERLWKGAFIHPVDNPTTDSFGMKRLYNGQLQRFHGGMDFKAPMGTPIRASSSGTVLLAKDLFYSGGTVIIDHGYGLLTMYFHMSRIDIKKGQVLKAGQLLGLSGKTGRVTGPHLHFEVLVHQVKVNPKDLFEEVK